MTVIRKQDVISSVADALQYISYYHPLDFVKALEKAYQREESQAAKDSIAPHLSGYGYCHLFRQYWYGRAMGFDRHDGAADGG